MTSLGRSFTIVLETESPKEITTLIKEDGDVDQIYISTLKELRDSGSVVTKEITIPSDTPEVARLVGRLVEALKLLMTSESGPESDYINTSSTNSGRRETANAHVAQSEGVKISFNFSGGSWGDGELARVSIAKMDLGEDPGKGRERRIKVVVGLIQQLMGL